MRKITYSDIDSSSENNLKDQTLYQEGRNLYVKGFYSDNTDFYAQFVSSVVDDATGGTLNLYISPDNSINFKNRDGSDIVTFNSFGTSFHREVNMNYQNMVALADPINAQDAAHKQYVDTKFAEAKEWIVVANTSTTNTAIPIPSQFATVADWLAGVEEGMIVVKSDNEYVATTIAAKAVLGFPAIFPLHKGGTHVAEFRFQSPTDTTFSVIMSNANNVTVLMR